MKKYLENFLNEFNYDDDAKQSLISDFDKIYSSEKALELAKENAKLNSAEIEFIQSDMFSALDNGQKFDVIISNPPYIKTQDMQSLQKEVKDFEPSIALDGGVDGLDFYRTIAVNAKKFLNSNGVVLLECGIGQANDISKMFDGYSKVEIIKDFENIDRIIKAVL
jgi:release factor glutamine methyltransferase